MESLNGRLTNAGFEGPVLIPQYFLGVLGVASAKLQCFHSLLVHLNN